MPRATLAIPPRDRSGRARGARDVVVATGRVPRAAHPGRRLRRSRPGSTQIHAHDYRNPDSPAARRRPARRLGPDRRPARRGAAGRRARGRALGRALRAGPATVSRPRLLLVGAPGCVDRGPDARVRRCRPIDTLPDPRMRFACNAHLSGHGGGHDTNLRRFAAGRDPTRRAVRRRRRGAGTLRPGPRPRTCAFADDVLRSAGSEPSGTRSRSGPVSTCRPTTVSRSTSSRPR